MDFGSARKLAPSISIDTADKVVNLAAKGLNLT